MHKITVFLIGILFVFPMLEASDEYEQKFYNQRDFFEYCTNEMKKEANAIQDIPDKGIRGVYKIQKYCERLALHPIDPYQSILLNCCVSGGKNWYVRLRGNYDFPNLPDIPELLWEVNGYLHKLNINYMASEQDLPFLVSKAVLASSAGRIWNVRPIFEIERKRTIQNPTNSFLRSVVTWDGRINFNNIYSKIYQMFSYLKTELDYSYLLNSKFLNYLNVKSLNELNYDDQYAYNQMLGFNIQNAGVDVCFQILKAQQGKNINFLVKELEERVLIWADLLSGKKSILDLDSDIQSLFTSFNLKKQIRLDQLTVDSKPLTTILGNEFQKIDPKMEIDDSTQLGEKTVNSLYGNADFVIAGFVPLLARDLVTEPRVELDIMLQKFHWLDDKTLYTSDEVGGLDSVCRLAQTHLGYNLIGYDVIKNGEKLEFCSSEGITIDFHPFLPIYQVLGVIENNEAPYYEYFPQTPVEQDIKAEAKARIDEGISDTIQEILQKRTSFSFWQLKKTLFNQLLDLQKLRRPIDRIDKFKNQMMKKYEEKSFDLCLEWMLEKENMNYRQILADQEMNNEAAEEEIRNSVFQEAARLVKNSVFQAHINNAFCFKTLSYNDENFIYRP